MNRHMNLFHFYGESESKEKLENNLTKGLALCLKYDPLFLVSFLSQVDNMFAELSIPDQVETFFSIDIQVHSHRVEAERIIAVPITLNEFKQDDYDKAESRQTEKPLIDMVISYADTAIVCEIKPSKENCLSQLKNQIHQCRAGSADAFHSFSWTKVTELLERVINLENNLRSASFVTSDYLDMLKGHFPSWQPIPKLHQLGVHDQNLASRIDQRLSEVCKDLPELQLTDRKRISYQLNWRIAAELEIEPELSKEYKSFDDIHIAFRFWAGDTKTQGEKIFTEEEKYVELLTTKAFRCGTETYRVKVTPYIKFASWNKGIAWLEGIPESDYKHFNQHLFGKIAGRNYRENWAKLNEYLEAFSKGWKEKSNWYDKVENSNRSQVVVSMGIKTEIKVPLSSLQEADKTKHGLSNKITEILHALNTKYSPIGSA